MMTIAEPNGAPIEGIAEYPIRVLLVDDQPIVAEAIRRALADEPNTAFHYCARGADAQATAAAVAPTVILQDLIMPDADGLDLVRRYRAAPATSAVPIVVLSSREEPIVKRDAFRAGANDYLVKLPDRIELVARIRYHSMAYVVQLQRDEAYRALRESQRRLLETNLELQRLTNVDGLTGLSNRKYFDEYIASAWAEAMGTGRPLSVLMIDVDHFKLYNDSYGHVGGDDVLRRVSEAIRRCVTRPADLAARYGGEEFVVVLPETGGGGLRETGAALCRAVSDLRLAHRSSQTSDHVTISVGGATRVPRPGQSPSALIEAADGALYEAKRGGRNRAVTRGQDVA